MSTTWWPALPVAATTANFLLSAPMIDPPFLSFRLYDERRTRKWTALMRASVGLREDRHHLRRPAGDHAARVSGKLLAEGNAADRDPELAHRLLGLRVLAPGRLDEAAGVGLLAGEELLELLERSDVIASPLAQALARLLEVAGVHVAEDAGDCVRRSLARDGVTGEPGVVAPGHRDHPLLDVPPAELDHHRHALADPLPA